MSERRRGLNAAIAEYLSKQPSGQASNQELLTAMSKKLGYDVPQSSVRSVLQDTKLFEPVSRGVHRLKA